VKLISVNVSRPKTVTWQGSEVRTGIFKEPVSVGFRKNNLRGANVLTVGDTPGFAGIGGIINFVLENGRVSRSGAGPDLLASGHIKQAYLGV
jgi:hypothetical protein